MGVSSAQMVRMSRLLDQALELDEAVRRKWLAALGPENQDIAEALREALSSGSTGTGASFRRCPRLGRTTMPASIAKVDSGPVDALVRMS